MPALNHCFLSWGIPQLDPAAESGTVPTLISEVCPQFRDDITRLALLPTTELAEKASVFDRHGTRSVPATLQSID